MVSLDDSVFLINHIRKCFLTGDDTGFCETLLGNQSDVNREEIDEVLNGKWIAPIVDSDTEDFLRYSPECPYVEDGLASYVQERSSSIALSNMKSKNSHTNEVRNLSASEIEHYFPIKPVSRQSTSCRSPQKSCLTLALEQAQADGLLRRTNLFADYSVHDARSMGTIPEPLTGNPPYAARADPASRQFMVWFWRISDFPRTFLCVQPRLETTVRQFVGLTFWQYFNQNTPSDPTVGPWNNLDRFDE